MNNSKNKNNNLISISGKIGSGKDMVGQIIQYLTSEVGIKGTRTFLEARGKTLPSGYGYSDYGQYNSPYQIKKYADKLKDIVSLFTGLSREQLEDREIKEKPLSKDYWFFKENNNEKIITIEEYKLLLKKDKFNFKLIKTTPRLLTQLIGTECFRKKIHPNSWVNSLFNEYKPIGTIIKKTNTSTYKEITHGYNKTRIFSIYHNMKQRCYNKNNPRYENYGGRGIFVCDQWLNSLEEFANWSMKNGYKDELTIDRIDNDKEYSPYNCRWVTVSTQNINQGIRKDNTSGYKGVCKEKNKWRAGININGKRVYLGSFNTPEEASEKYEEAFLKREQIYETNEEELKTYPNFIITDTRFPNECEAIKKRNGILIKIDRPFEFRFPELHQQFLQSVHIDIKEYLKETDFEMYKKLYHESETALDDYMDYDYIITNDGTIEDLVEKVREILIKEKVI